MTTNTLYTVNYNYYGKPTRLRNTDLDSMNHFFVKWSKELLAEAEAIDELAISPFIAIVLELMIEEYQVSYKLDTLKVMQYMNKLSEGLINHGNNPYISSIYIEFGD